MNAQFNKFLHMPLVTGGIAAILVSGLAIASFSISGQGPAEAPDTASLSAVTAPAASAYRCSECGVIESTREVGVSDPTSGGDARARAGATPFRNYEITIRRQDGTMSVIRDPKPAKWRHGEPVTIIAGAD
jgi:hypothetical protein